MSHMMKDESDVKKLQGLDYHLSPVRFPNGVYRNLLMFNVKNESNFVSAWIHFETYEANNGENVMWYVDLFFA